MSIKRDYRIQPVSYQTAMNMVIANHYLHRKTSCSFAFGLFSNADDEMVGVIVYGTPSSAPLRRGVCGDEHAGNVIELTRLWIADKVGRNAESYLIGNTIPLVDKQIIVSYADTEAGHTGVVYQATNWIYTGLSAKRTNWTVEGVSKHCQTIADKHTAAELREIYGDKFTLKERSRKHRYVYFNADKRRKAELLDALKYPVQPYPKPANDNMQPSEQAAA